MVLQSQSCASKSCVTDFMFHPPPSSPSRRKNSFIIRSTLAEIPVSTSSTRSNSSTGTKIPPTSNSKPPAPTPAQISNPQFPIPFLDEALRSGRAAATTLCDTVESFIAEYIDPREYPPSRDPKVQLADNFAPVAESPPQACLHVVGKIPACLRGGAYLRNGSNPLHPPAAGYHYFDGHGMVHSVKFSDEEDGDPIYCARFTKTNRYVQENAAGKPLIPNSLGDMSSYAGLARFGLFVIRTALGIVDVFGGLGTSNAGMGYFDRRIMAMSEDDLPYTIRLTPEGDLVTMGRYSFNKGLSLPMCAHPKKDPVTGELFAFSFNPVINPHLRYFWSTPEGKKSRDFDINLPEPCLFHDFAITENYAVFPENQLVMKLENLVLKNQPPIAGDSSKIPRFGIIPRFPAVDSRPQWIEVPDWTSFHYVNAWEEGDEIVLLGSSVKPVECLFDEVGGLESRLYEIHLDLRSGRSYKQHVCSGGLDLGQINQRFLGRKSRFAYMCHYGPWPKFSGLTKVDLERPRLPRLLNGVEDPVASEPSIAATRRFEPGTFCSEPYFVPRSEEGGDEDDGYVLSHVHNETSGNSELLVMDAKSPTLETVAAIRMPTRVPYGFHGVFVSADQIANQSHVPL